MNGVSSCVGAQPATAADEMGLADYGIFVGYIAAFIAFFYGVAALLGGPK